jgi:hypothetical protein
LSDRADEPFSSFLVPKQEFGHEKMSAEFGPRGLLVEYDDDRELTRYVWDHFSRLMTDFERRVGVAIFGQQKASSFSLSTEASRVLLARWGHTDDPEVNAALADGPEAFRRRVCRRVLANSGAAVFVNRCPQCGRVVRTPQAHQCFWCGHDWHGNPAE